MTTTQIRGIEVNGAKVENAQQFARQFAHAPDWYDGINRVACPSGSAPGEGKFLVHRADFEANWPEDAVFDIVFQRHDGTSLMTTTLKNYVTLSAHAALRIKDGGPMVVKVVDVRYLLARKHINKVFNVDDDSSDWLAVLASLANDVPAAYGDALAFETVPTYTPSNLRYEGWSIIDAIADVAHRTSHTLIYNPIDGKLRLKNMKGSQSIVANALHRNWEVPATTFASAIGVVAVNVDIDGSELSEILERTQGAAVNTATAWAARKKNGSNQAAVDAEANELADTWFDWSDRKATRRVREFFGSLPIECGSQVGKVTWHVADNDLFTIVDEDAPPEPITKRQPQRSSTAMKNGDFACCACPNSELHFSIEGEGITGVQVREENVWPVMSAGGLLQKIILTSDDDPAVTREIELPLVDCAALDCQTLDMTGEFVGAREIVSIDFGNSATCAPTECPAYIASPYVFAVDEQMTVLPITGWTDTSDVAPTVVSGKLRMAPTDAGDITKLQHTTTKPKSTPSEFHLMTSFSSAPEVATDPFSGPFDYSSMSIYGVALGVAGGVSVSGITNDRYVNVVSDISPVFAGTVRFTKPLAASHDFELRINGANVDYVLDGVVVYSEPYVVPGDWCSGVAMTASMSAFVNGGSGSVSVFLIDYLKFGWT